MSYPSGIITPGTIRQEDSGAERKTTHFRIGMHSYKVKTHHYIIFFVRQLHPELEMRSYG